MMSIEWLDEEPTQEELNDGEPAVETAEEYGETIEVFPVVPAPPEPEVGQNDGEETQ